MKFLVVCLCLVATFARAESVRLCYEDENVFPWLLKGGKGSHVILMEMVAAKTGVKIELIAQPWKRCLAELRSGGVDGAFQASYTAERAKFAAYPMAGGKPDASRRISTGSYMLYRAKGSPVSWDGSKFSNLTGPIGAQFGYSIVEDLKAKGVQVVDISKTADANARNLLGGRLQAVALLALEGDYVLQKPEFAGKLEKVSVPLVDKLYFVIFNKEFHGKKQALVESLWAAIAAVRDSAEFKAKEQAILKK